MKNLNTPKYIRLKEYIKERIQEGDIEPGEKFYSENELAARFSISRHTVRQAIGEMENEGWLYRVQGSGTFVNRVIGKQKEKSKMIGVIISYLDDYIFPSIIKGIDHILTSQGYSVILSHTNNKIGREAACLANMLEKNVDGFIIEPTKSALPNPNLSFYDDLEKKGIPYIFINGYYPTRESSFVVEDDELGGSLAASHLFELGHRKIGGLFKIDDIQGHGRYRGVVKAHQERGVDLLEEAFAWFTTEDAETLFDGRGLPLLKRFEGCTGIVCYNDQIALKLLEAFRQEGIRVPEDISVVSFDDSELAMASETKLTTIAHPGFLLGEKAATSLLDILKFNKNAVKEIMKPALVVRNSTASPANTR